MPTWHTALVAGGTCYTDKIYSNLLFGYSKTLYVGNTKEIRVAKGKIENVKERETMTDRRGGKQKETTSCAV